MALDTQAILDGIVADYDADGVYDQADDKQAAKQDSREKLEPIVSNIVQAIKNDAEVSTTVSSGIPVSVDTSTGDGSTTDTGSGSGGVS